MQTHNPLLALLALLSFLAPAWAQTAPLSYPFRLQTLVTRGAPHLADLWVSSYHTAAGQSDLVLVPNRTSAAQWFVTANSTLQLDRGGGGFAWNVVLAPSMGYAGWEVTTMRAGGKGTDGFGLAADAFGPLVLTWTTERMKAAANPTDDANQFFSWLVCDWSHGVPQLFWRVKHSTVSSKLPPLASCAEVKLRVVQDLEQNVYVKGLPSNDAAVR